MLRPKTTIVYVCCCDWSAPSEFKDCGVSLLISWFYIYIYMMPVLVENTEAKREVYFFFLFFPFQFPWPKRWGRPMFFTRSFGCLKTRSRRCAMTDLSGRRNIFYYFWAYKGTPLTMNCFSVLFVCCSRRRFLQSGGEVPPLHVQCQNRAGR